MPLWCLSVLHLSLSCGTSSTAGGTTTDRPTRVLGCENGPTPDWRKLKKSYIYRFSSYASQGLWHANGKKRGVLLKYAFYETSIRINRPRTTALAK